MSTQPIEFPDYYPPDPPPDWADEYTLAWCTCHTPGCICEDYPIPLYGYWSDGETLYRVGAFWCGPCGVQMWDVTLTEPTPEEPDPDPEDPGDGEPVEPQRKGR